MHKLKKKEEGPFRNYIRTKSIISYAWCIGHSMSRTEGTNDKVWSSPPIFSPAFLSHGPRQCSSLLVLLAYYFVSRVHVHVRVIRSHYKFLHMIRVFAVKSDTKVDKFDFPCFQTEVARGHQGEPEELLSLSFSNDSCVPRSLECGEHCTAFVFPSIKNMPTFKLLRCVERFGGGWTLLIRNSTFLPRITFRLFQTTEQIRMDGKNIWNDLLYIPK